MATTRIGLVGYGFGGKVFHAPLIAAAEGCSLAGVVTSSPERKEQVAADHPGVASYDSLAEMIEAGVDAVAVSTPARTHIPLVMESIGAGVPVVSDKPFALDAIEARGAVEAAEAAGVLLSVYQNRRWDSDFLTLRSLIEAGSLGDVVAFESRFERFSPPDKPVGAAGAGLLLDFGSHLIDQAVQLFGPAVSVYAELRTRNGAPVPPGLDAAFEDDWFVALTHSGGVRSHIAGNWWQPAPGPRFRVVGTDGAYVVRELMDGQEAALKSGLRPDDGTWGTEPESAWGTLERGADVTVVPTLRGRWDSFYPAFGAAVRGEGPVPVDPWDAVNNLLVLDAARRGAADRRVVEL